MHHSPYVYACACRMRNARDDMESGRSVVEPQGGQVLQGQGEEGSGKEGGVGGCDCRVPKDSNLQGPTQCEMAW